MKFYINDYNFGYRMLRVIKGCDFYKILYSVNIPFVHVQEDCVTYYPDNSSFKYNEEIIRKFKQLNNYDVIEIYDNGIVFRIYDSHSNDNTIFITPKCNN